MNAELEMDYLVPTRTETKAQLAALKEKKGAIRAQAQCSEGFRGDYRRANRRHEGCLGSDQIVAEGLKRAGQ